MTEPNWDGGAPVREHELSSMGASVQASGEMLGLSHSEVRAHLSDYLEGNLPEIRLRQIREHLDGCPSCRAFLATFGQTVELLNALPQPRAPSSAKRRLLDQVRASIVQR